MEVKKKRSALEIQCFQGLRVSESTLSLKGGANFEGETAPATEKRLKKQKNKTAKIRGKAYFHAF